MVARSGVVLCCTLLLGVKTASAQGLPRGEVAPAVSKESGATVPGESAPAISNASDERGPEEREAQRVFLEGLRHLRAEQWVEAEQMFRRSLALAPRQSTMYNLALVLFKQRRPKESLSMLKALLRDSKARSAGQASESQRYAAYAESLLPHVLVHVSTLELSINVADAQVWVDGRPVSKKGSRWATALDPGRHHVEVSATAFQSATLDVVLERGVRQERSIELSPSTDSATIRPVTRDAAGNAAPASGSSTIGTVGPWATIGLGSALLVGGVITGILAKRADDEFVEGCPELQNCDPELKDVQDKALGLARASDVLLISGGVVVAGGVVWRVLTPSRARHSAAVSVSGRF